MNYELEEVKCSGCGHVVTKWRRTKETTGFQEGDVGLAVVHTACDGIPRLVDALLSNQPFCFEVRCVVERCEDWKPRD